MIATVKVAAAQFAPAIDDDDANLRAHLRLARTAADHGAGLLIFPELSLTGYDHDRASARAIDPDDPRLAELAQLSRDAGMAIVVGAPLRGPGKPKIGAVILLTDGGTAIYEKQHLHAGEEAWFDPGAGGGLLDLADLAVAHAICADIAEESHAAAAAVRGAALYAAGVLITPAGYDADAALLQSYAAIHGMAVLLANYHGHSGRWPCAGRSAFWSADGRLLACAPADCDALVIATRDDNGWSATVVPA